MTGNTNRPTVFFSHSSRDARPLGRLKELFTSKTGGTIDVFLSSDGQSIPFGHRWVHRIEEALANARIVFVFLSPSALESGWVYFESGHAYAKGIRVVPIGMYGMRLGDLGPPISLLQGFDLVSRDSLDNLIAIANDTFGHKHLARFADDEAEEILLAPGLSAGSSLGDFANVIDDIYANVGEGNGLAIQPSVAFERIRTCLQENGVDFSDSSSALHLTGMSIAPSTGRLPQELEIQIDPRCVGDTLPLLDKVLSPLMRPTTRPALFIVFKRSIRCLVKPHQISARLHGAARFSADSSWGAWTMPNLSFSPSATSRNAALSINFVGELDSSALRDLLALLFERDVLGSQYALRDA